MYPRNEQPHTRRRLLTRAAALLLAVGALVTAAPRSHAESSREYQLKAAFLYNFVKFIDWPPAVEARPSVRIGIAGKAALEGAMEQINGKRIKEKPVTVVPLNGPQDVANCQIVFVASSDQARAKGILDAAKNASVLTVGETDAFTKAGGIMTFVPEGNKIRFEINPDAAERAHLTISSQLLKLAKVVHGR